VTRCTVTDVTSVRPAPTSATRTVRPLGTADRDAVEQLVGEDPVLNSVVASRLAALGSLDPARLGGTLLGAYAGRMLSAAVFNGGNLLPIGGDDADWAALAEHLTDTPRRCTSIVGPADAVAAMWRVLEPAWGPARAVRADQPLLVLSRGTRPLVREHPGLRVMNLGAIEAYLPAAAAMFREELGISPFAGAVGNAYRRRVESLLATGRAFGVLDDDGRVVFKADIGALTPDTCQLQGVWVRPDLRGRGIGTAALAGVIRHALRLAPSVSLYVNDFNAPARRMYAKLGMRQVDTLSTVLF
jgi:predicted GNAT family acetyltransferase